MNLEKVFNFIKEKKGYDVPDFYSDIYKIKNNIPLSDNKINYRDTLNLDDVPSLQSLGNLKSVRKDLYIENNPNNKL